jgi:hypothetical protein
MSLGVRRGWTPGRFSGRRFGQRGLRPTSVGHRPRAMPRLRRSWAMQRTVLAELASTSPVRQLCPTGVGGTAPCCRGQALPDPPAHRAGHHAIAGRRCAESTHGAPDHTRAIARKDASPSGAGVDCRASRPAGEAAPRPYMNRPTHHRCRTCLPRWGGILHFVGVRRCLTCRPAGPADRRQRVRWCLDHRCRGGRQRTPGAEAPGSVRKPPEGGCEVHSRLGRSAGCRGRVDQPAPAGLGTEPGRSRPGDRGEGRSADRRCVSGETCRPRGIAAPIGAVGRGSASPLQGGATHPRSGGRVRRVGRSRPSGKGQALPDPPARRAGRDTRGLSASVTERSPPARVCRAFPVPVARRARRRLAPTGIGRRVRRSGSRAPRVGATSPAW